MKSFVLQEGKDSGYPSYCIFHGEFFVQNICEVYITNVTDKSCWTFMFCSCEKYKATIKKMQHSSYFAK